MRAKCREMYRDHSVRRTPESLTVPRTVKEILELVSSSAEKRIALDTATREIEDKPGRDQAERATADADSATLWSSVESLTKDVEDADTKVVDFSALLTEKTFKPSDISQQLETT